MPFKGNAARRHRIPKQRYRVRNWQKYDAALRARGSLTVWFSDEAVPPCSTAVPSDSAQSDPTPRDRHPQAIADSGRRAWQATSG